MVCEYQFIDEELADVIERLKEMLDFDATIDKLDTKQELPAENGEKSVPTGRIYKVLLLCRQIILFMIYKLSNHIVFHCISSVLNILNIWYLFY